jgi:GMP reductase
MAKKFDFNDILIKPAVISVVKSRKEVNPYHNGYLPLITAPMDTVVSLENKDLFDKLKINLCLPRGIEYDGGFVSYSLDEIKEKLDNLNLRPNGKYLIDIANGHMVELVNTIQQIKYAYPNVTLMVGNVANPRTYMTLSNAGADYVRVGIGGGSACTTTVHTGVGYPMASLIKECYEYSLRLAKPAKIVADGGMQNYSDIIKALALGADYVMVGGLFNKSIESCGENYLWGRIKVPQCVAEFAFKRGIPVYKKFRGMSTKEVQKKWGKKNLTTSEGVVRKRKVEHSLVKWVDNFTDYLRSSMSYTSSFNLDEFIGHVDTVKITDNAYNRFKK